MVEILALSIGLGLAAGLLMTELFGIASGGLIVPGYMALYLTRPWDIVLTLAVAYATFALVRTLSSFLIIYGRRRSALMIMMGYLIGMLVRYVINLPFDDVAIIGFIIPGLIALWMDRQGVLQTFGSLIIVSVIVRLALLLTVGAEMLP